MLPSILSRAGPLPAAHASDGEALRRGRIYVAPADVHMLLDGDTIRLARGPKENLYRPAVDPLFRSAAVAFGPRVTGVVLTGALDDGTAGLAAVKRSGGIAIVQDPDSATYPSMPASAARNVNVDYMVAPSGIAQILDRLVRERVPARPSPAPDEIKLEVGMAAMDSNEEKLDRIGRRSTFTCPECRGTLWEMNGEGALRYRCHVGHAYTGETLIASQANGLEEALWAAIRGFEENATLADKMAARSRQSGHDRVVSRLSKRAETARFHASELRRLLDQIEAVTEPAS
jgi:two-component system chemotaxis response regulator CheB